MGYQNDQVNEINTQAQLETDAAKREQMYIEAQKLILDDAIMVVLGYPSRAMGAAKAVQHLQLSPVGLIVLREVDLA
jgi:ABC-type transport system substrate-binding protein